MSLSNTSAPRYFRKFCEQVANGSIPVNEEIRLEMDRIEALIADPRYYYDDKAVEGWIAFCENELVLTDGSDLNLLDSFKVWGEEIFGWYEFVERSVYQPNPDGHGGHYVNKRVKKRLTNKQYLIVGRGAAKTQYISSIHDYVLNVDTTATKQIAVGPTMAQGDLTLAPIQTAILRSRGPLFQFLTDGSLQNTTGDTSKRVKLASTKKGIQNFLNGSILEVKPMSIDKLQGLQPKCSTVDEWLSCDIREDPIGAIEQGACKVDDYIIIATSSEGTIRNGVGDTIKMELSKILRGEYLNPHVSIFWYKLDKIEEVADPAMWVKANPNLGKTVSYEAYQLDVERAEKAPSARNDILAKRFGIPVEGFTYFFPYEETIRHPYRSYDGMPCALGGDLSKGDDFCSFTFLFPLRDDSFGIKTRNYISSRTLINLQNAMRQKYDEFIQEGSLVVFDGIVLKMDDIYDDLDEFIQEHGYDVRCFGYDPYNADKFVERWATENGPYGIDKVIQGSRTETVPLGELKNLSEERMLLFDEKIFEFAMGNAVVFEDSVNKSRKLAKIHHDEKIDPVSAMMDAYISYKDNTDQFD